MAARSSSELTLVNHDCPEGATVYNTVGEIPGTDKADEVGDARRAPRLVARGAGATDNAIGSRSCSRSREFRRRLA